MSRCTVLWMSKVESPSNSLLDARNRRFGAKVMYVHINFLHWNLSSFCHHMRSGSNDGEKRKLCYIFFGHRENSCIQKNLYSEWMFLYFSVQPIVRQMSAVSHCGDPGSLPGQFGCDLPWSEWHWVRFCPTLLGLGLSVTFHQCSVLIHSFHLRCMIFATVSVSDNTQ